MLYNKMQTFKIKANDLDKFMNKLATKIEEQIPLLVAKGIGNASSKTIVDEMRLLGTDNAERLVHSFKSIIAQKSVKKFVIGQFNSPGSHLLEYGTTSPYYTMLGLPRVISFNEEPELEDWVQGNNNLTDGIREKFLREQKVPVGFERTRYGKRKWLSSYIISTKPLLKEYIHNSLKELKI